MADKTASSPVVMSASGANTANTPAATPKKAATPKSSKPRTKPTHPRTSEMVNAAIKTLRERGGSSLQAIKKYISSTYKLDAEKHASFIKKYLKTAVASGILVQTKGKGAAGSFRLASIKLEAGKLKSPQGGTKVTAAKKAPVQKKAAPPKKAAVKKPPAKKAIAAAVNEKRKAAKGPAAKPPKPKTAAPKTKTIAKAAPKKAQPKKATVTKAKKPVPKKSVPKKK